MRRAWLSGKKQGENTLLTAWALPGEQRRLGVAPLGLFSSAWYQGPGGSWRGLYKNFFFFGSAEWAFRIRGNSLPGLPEDA